MKKNFILTLVSVLAFAVSAGNILEPQGLSGSKRPVKKFIYFGWGAPRTLEQWSLPEEVFDKDCPFDGMAFKPLLELERDGKTVWFNTSDANWDRSIELRESDFDAWVKLLKSKNFTKLKYNFVSTTANFFTPKWFDDALWQRSLNNYRQYVRFAKNAGLRGISLDLEMYPSDDKAFVYNGVSGYTFEETEKKVRERGREFARMIAEEYPDMVMFALLWSSDSLNPFRCDNLAAQKDINLALMPAFMNGIYDEIPETVTIVDGNEDPGYRAATAADFDRVVANYERYARYWIAPENQKKYKTVTSRGMAIYMDAYTGKVPSYQEVIRSTDNPVRLLQENVARTLESAEEWAWMWAEQGTFWEEFYTPELRKKWGQSMLYDWNKSLPFAREAIIYGTDPVKYAKKHAVGPNLVKNSDLDDENGQTPHWRFWQPRESVPGKYAAANGTAKMVQVASGCIAQDREDQPLKPGKRYIYTARARMHGDQCVPTIGLNLLDAKGRHVDRKIDPIAAFGEPGADGWREAAVIVDIPENFKYHTLRLLLSSRGSRFGIPEGNWCEFDKAELREVVYPWDKGYENALASEAEATGILTRNSDLNSMKGKVTDWAYWRHPKSKGSVVPGDGTVKIAGAAEGVLWQEVKKIKAGESYLFSVKARSNGNVKPTFSLYLVDANDKILMKTVKKGSFGEADADGWCTGEVVYAVPENVDFALVRLQFGSKGKFDADLSDSYCEFDRAELRHIVAPLTRNKDLNSVNGKITDWLFWKESKTSGSVVPGEGTAKFDGVAQGVLLQNVKKVKAGETYVFTAKARSFGQVKPTLSLYLVDAKDSILMKTVRNGSFGEPDADGWCTGKIVYTVPDDVEFDHLRLMIGSRGPKNTDLSGSYCEFGSAELKAK